MWEMEMLRQTCVWPRLRVLPDGTERRTKFAALGLIHPKGRVNHVWVAGCGDTVKESVSELYLQAESHHVAPFDIRMVLSLQSWSDGLWMLWPLYSKLGPAFNGPDGVDLPFPPELVMDVILRQWPNLPEKHQPTALPVAFPGDSAGTPVDPTMMIRRPEAG